MNERVERGFTVRAVLAAHTILLLLITIAPTEQFSEKLVVQLFSKFLLNNVDVGFNFVL